MIQKKIALMSTIILCMTACLAGCAKTKEQQEEPPQLEIEPIEPEEQEEEPVVEEEPEEEEPDSLVIEERVEKDGKIQSYLTGQWTDVAQAKGRITRLMGVFENFDDLDRIGPVRSSRDYYVYQAMGYEAIYCNWGLAVPYVEELINRPNYYNVSAAVVGIHNPADEAFGRHKRPGYATEFTGYLFIDGLFKAVDRLGYDWNYDDKYVPPFLFAADDVRAEYTENEDAVYVYPGGKTASNSGGYGAYHPYFEYHEDDQLYYRYQDGKKQIDELTGDQLTVSNVAFQYCHGEVRDDHDYLAFGVHGEGEAIVFTNGKVIKGTWKRFDGDFTPAKFFDEAGEEIVFNQGSTWICNIWDEYGEFVEYGQE